MNNNIVKETAKFKDVYNCVVHSLLLRDEVKIKLILDRCIKNFNITEDIAIKEMQYIRSVNFYNGGSLDINKAFSQLIDLTNDRGNIINVKKFKEWQSYINVRSRNVRYYMFDEMLKELDSIKQLLINDCTIEHKVLINDVQNLIDDITLNSHINKFMGFMVYDDEFLNYDCVELVNDDNFNIRLINELLKNYYSIENFNSKVNYIIKDNFYIYDIVYSKTMNDDKLQVQLYIDYDNAIIKYVIKINDVIINEDLINYNTLYIDLTTDSLADYFINEYYEN